MPAPVCLRHRLASSRADVPNASTTSAVCMRMWCPMAEIFAVSFRVVASPFAKTGEDPSKSACFQAIQLRRGAPSVRSSNTAATRIRRQNIPD